VFVDPRKKGIAWEYSDESAAIVGAPQIIDGTLVAAHQNRRFVALNPADGKRLGAGYRLEAQVAPATAPAPFGPGRLFAPLTDGTVMLLTLKQLGVRE
jgi:hypothetical protein